MRPPATLVSISCWIIALGALIMFGAAWVIPLDVLQSWAVQRAADNDFARFEAMGQAEALAWLFRVTAPIALLTFWPSRKRTERLARWIGFVLDGFSQATRSGRDGADDLPAIWSWRTCLLQWRTCLLQGFCAAWGGLAIVHFVGAVDQRTGDWAYYRLNSGPSVLPNISESNRMVIRYLSRATPEDARILILSDQKLYFISYYLLPRRIYHPLHPDAEFVIARAGQERPLAAWRLSDLDEDYLQQLDPDYVVEYFEGPEYVNSDRLTEDSSWISFAREWHRQPDYVPPFNLTLRRWSGEGESP